MSAKKQINIFLVEDNQVFTLALKADIEAAFANKPIAIQSFETGEACMEKFKKDRPEVVILDYNLNSKYPKAMDGIKILDWVKRENPETHVIMLTSEDSIDIVLRSLKHGASDYVVKSETKFKKINFSLTNIFKIMEATSDGKRYKRVIAGVVLCFAILVVGVVTIQIVNPGLLR